MACALAEIGDDHGIRRRRHLQGAPDAGPRRGWVPVHVTVNLVEIDQETFAGLVALRLPTPAELTEAGLSESD
jgi:hypothetical protein